MLVHAQDEALTREFAVQADDARSDGCRWRLLHRCILAERAAGRLVVSALVKASALLATRIGSRAHVPMIMFEQLCRSRRLGREAGERLAWRSSLTVVSYRHAAQKLASSSSGDVDRSCMRGRAHGLGMQLRASARRDVVLQLRDTSFGPDHVLDRRRLRDGQGRLLLRPTTGERRGPQVRIGSTDL